LPGDKGLCQTIKILIRNRITTTPLRSWSGDQNAVSPVGDQQNAPAQTTTDATGTDLGNPVRLANYMASTFVGQGDGYGDQMITTDPGQSVAQQPFLTNPH
jgi:hypothetical protein